MPKAGEKEESRRQHPRSEKWLQQCIICQTIGYKPDMPKTIGIGLLAENIRKLYIELELNISYMCNECSRNFDKTNN
jgi:hypothetical protein